MKTPSLFDEADDEFQIHPTRKQPLIWLSELRFLHSLDEDAEFIREPIPFRRGLNIIATSKNTGTGRGAVGHSVGKSLLMRLIRYCLGEPGYAERHVRQAICDHFPSGYVVATFVVDGTPWYVARPIGLASPSSASWTSSISIESLSDRDHRQPLRVFTDHLQQLVIDPLATIELPKARRALRWTDLIGWLAPDQKCAHKSHVTWRPGGTEPYNRGLTVADNHVIVRTVMDLLTADDSGLLATHERLLSDQGRLNRTIDIKQAVIDSARTNLIADLPSGFADQQREILAVQAVSYADAQLKKMRALLDDEMEGDPLEGWREKNNQVQRDVATLRQKIQFEVGDRDAARAVLDSIDDGSHAQQIQANADLGKFCHLFLTKDDAMASGCPGKVAASKPIKDPVEERLKADQQQIVSDCKARITTLTEQLTQKEQQAEEFQAEYLRTFTAVEQRRQPLRKKIGQLEQLERDAIRFQTLCEELTTLEGQKSGLKKSIKDSLTERRTADQRHKTNRQKLIHCFNEALQRTTGSTERGTIDINARGIFPRPEVGFQSEGEAVGTSTILAFDVACMLASMGGLGNHPRFLLDDSPRDADLEPPMYQQLLQSIADLELLSSKDEPAFQYILTTTTRPNKTLAKDPYLRLTLDRITDENMLLGVRF